MADLDFDADLKAMFDRAPPAPDADVFADRVVARLERLAWIRAGVIGGLGLVGALIAWLQIGWSPTGFTLGVGDLTGSAMDNGGPWLAALLVLVFGLLLVRPSLSES